MQKSQVLTEKNYKFRYFINTNDDVWLKSKKISILPKSLDKALEQLRDLQLDSSFMYKKTAIYSYFSNWQFCLYNNDWQFFNYVMLMYNNIHFIYKYFQNSNVAFKIMWNRIYVCYGQSTYTIWALSIITGRLIQCLSVV